MTASGYILFDKPAGRTSFSALSGFKRALPGSRIGHTGTLDSFATGLLVVMVGGYSRLSSWFVGLDKVYEADVRFGLETDTLDPNGTVTKKGAVPSREALEETVPAFMGSIEQVPPEYSAIHVSGERASERARKGESFRLAPRKVAIQELSIVSFSGDTARIHVHCSSGTYIRALARDMAAACGSCAHLSGLRRTKVGPFSVSDACASADEGAADHLRRLNPGDAALLGLGFGFLPEALEPAFANGIPLALGGIAVEGEPEGDIAVFSASRKLLGLVGRRAGRLVYRLVISRETEDEG